MFSWTLLLKYKKEVFVILLVSIISGYIMYLRYEVTSITTKFETYKSDVATAILKRDATIAKYEAKLAGIEHNTSVSNFVGVIDIKEKAKAKVQDIKKEDSSKIISDIQKEDKNLSVIDVNNSDNICIRKFKGKFIESNKINRSL
jgi:23S rRNA pseudoU1915 N3-methylase RlmH